MKFSKLLALLLVVALVGGMFVGCGQKTDPAAPAEETTAPAETEEAAPAEEATEPAVEVEQVLRLMRTADLPSLNSSIATDTSTFEVLGNTVLGLFRLGPNDVPENAMVDTYEMSDDGLHWTFHLKKNVMWSNGVEVDANDFVYAWRRLADPEVAGQYSFMMEIAGLENAGDVMSGEKPLEELGIVATDDYTIELNLTQPVPFMKGLLTFPSFYPINQEFREEKGDTYGTSVDTMLYSGPFVLSKWETEYEYVLAKNENYYDADSVSLEEVSFRIVKDPNTAVNLYETGEVDMSRLSGEQIEQYADHPHLTAVDESVVFYLELNQEDAVFANLNARKAFAYAIDKSFITEEILADGSVVADYLVPTKLAFGPDSKDFRETAGKYNSFDKDKAAEYWALAKKELGVETLEIELLVGDAETTGRIGEYIQAQIAANLEGCTLTINAQPFKNRLALTKAKKFSAVMSGWGPDYGDPMTFLDLFVTTSPFNKSGYSSEEYDTIIERCQKGDLTQDLVTRWSELQRAEQILIEQDAAVLPIWQRGRRVLQQPKITGLERHAFAPDIAYWDIVITE